MRWLICVLIALATACTAEIPEARLECDTAADCPPAWFCRSPQQRCYMTPAPDGGSSDAGSSPSDAGSDGG